jgi:hypothetical protein
MRIVQHVFAHALRCILTGAGLLALTASVIASPALAADTVPSSVLGAYTGYGNVTTDNAISAQLGTPLAFGSDYVAYAQGWSGITNPDIESRWSNSGYRMTYGLPMFPTTCSVGSATCWNAGAAGAYDSYFTTVAQNLVEYGQGNAILRIGWEFNVPGEYSWYASGFSAQFVLYWQNIVNTMRAVPGANFAFDWNPNIGSAISNLSAYYPGNSYVDAVGFDLFDWGWKTYPGAQQVWSNYLTENQGLNWLVSFGAANDKPLTLPEWGLGTTTQPAGSGNVAGGDDPYFVDQVYSFISGNNFMEAGLWDYKGVFPNSSLNPDATAALISDFQ